MEESDVNVAHANPSPLGPGLGPVNVAARTGCGAAAARCDVGW
jgi:hypothetical protein